jgi:hypothetical protein
VKVNVPWFVFSIKEGKMLQCSFCRKTEDQVAKLVAGPDVYICNECVVVAARLMIEPRGFFRRLWDRLRSVGDHFIRRRMAGTI